MTGRCLLVAVPANSLWQQVLKTAENQLGRAGCRAGGDRHLTSGDFQRGGTNRRSAVT